MPPATSTATRQRRRPGPARSRPIDPDRRDRRDQGPDRAAHRRPRARTRPRARGRRRRSRHRARGPARHQQDDDAQGDHRGVGHPAAVRRGQCRPHPGEDRRAPQPRPGAARGLQRGQFRARAAGGSHAGRRVSLHRGVQPGSGRHPEHPADRDRRPGNRGAAGRHHHRGEHLPGDRLDEPVRQCRHHQAVDQRARPALPAGHRLPERSRGTGHRGAAGARGSGRTQPATHRRTGLPSPGPPAPHPDVRQGSSVRGAIDTVLVAAELGCAARGLVIDGRAATRRHSSTR